MQRHRLIATGEWALALHTSTWEGYDDEAKAHGLKEYAAAQMDAYSRGSGYFFWTFKVRARLDPLASIRDRYVGQLCRNRLLDIPQSTMCSG